MSRVEKQDYTVVYYTSNFLDDRNPHFLANTRKQLLEACEGAPIVIVSQKPTMFGENSVNVNMGDIGRGHLNIYRQILEGCKRAKTKWVVLAEDDILYSKQHFNFHYFVKPEFIEDDYFLYDMNKVSIFTWTKPPCFSFRFKRQVVNHLIAKREMLIDSLGQYIARSRLKSDGKLDAIEEPDIKKLLKKIKLNWEDKPRLEKEKIND